MDDRKRLDLNLLVTLEALLAEQNVTRAALRLHLSQPAVSAQLSRLRDLFDDPLLLPARRGMLPTARALELRAPLRDALDQVRGLLDPHRRFDPAHDRLTVAIAATDYVQAAVVQPVAIALRKRAPGVRIAVHQLDPERLQEQMDSGQVDLAVMSPEHAPDTLRSRPLFDERYVLVGHRRHPRLRRGMTVEEFAALDHVVVSLRGGGFSTPVDEQLAALGHRRRVGLSVASFLAVPGIVASSDFVALVPERLVRHQRDGLKVVECPVPVRGFQVGMLWHERSHAHSGHRWVRDAIAELLGETR